MFGLIAGKKVIESVQLGIIAATALYLLPIVVRIFMMALNPIADAATSRMKKVLKSDQEVYIGLDNPMLLGEDAIWIVVMMCMPVTLLLAFLLPWNQILPFAALDNLTLGLCVYMVTNGKHSQNVHPLHRFHSRISVGSQPPLLPPSPHSA